MIPPKINHDSRQHIDHDSHRCTWFPGPSETRKPSPHLLLKHHHLSPSRTTARAHGHVVGHPLDLVTAEVLGNKNWSPIQSTRVSHCSLSLSLTRVLLATFTKTGVDGYKNWLRKIWQKHWWNSDAHWLVSTFLRISENCARHIVIVISNRGRMRNV